MDYSKVMATWWSGNCYHLEQLNAIISSTDIKSYAYILHDKCHKEDNTNELKKPHYHFLVQLHKNQRGSWFKQFKTEDMGIVFAQPCRVPESAYNYLIHDTDTCRKQKKFLYSEDERISTIDKDNFETEDKDAKKQTNTEKFFIRLYEGATNLDLQKEFPSLYAQYGVDKIEKFRQDWLRREYGDKMRDIKVTFIYGATRLGKTSYVYDKFKPSEVCRVTNYRVGTFENYNRQRILILDEFTGHGQFDIPFLNNLLDRLPIELPARYTNRTACYDEVYIISNLPLDQIYMDEKSRTPQVHKAFVERIHDIIKFTDFKKWHYEMRDKKSVKFEVAQTEMGMRVLTPDEEVDLPW